MDTFTGILKKYSFNSQVKNLSMFNVYLKCTETISASKHFFDSTLNRRLYTKLFSLYKHIGQNQEKINIQLLTINIKSFTKGSRKKVLF